MYLIHYFSAVHLSFQPSTTFELILSEYDTKKSCEILQEYVDDYLRKNCLSQCWDSKIYELLNKPKESFLPLNTDTSISCTKTNDFIKSAGNIQLTY